MTRGAINVRPVTYLRALPRLVAGIAGLALIPVMMAPAHAATGASRTWVSGVGDDANPCSRTAPCKTFAGAIGKTAEGGVISVLDPGGFGAVTITKSITINADSSIASILAVGQGSAITINAPATAKVTLRGLDLISFNDPGTCATEAGIRILSAGTVRLDDLTLNGFGTGVDVPTTSSLALAMSDLDISGSCTAGISLAPADADTATSTPAGSVTATLSGSSITDNPVGLAVTARAELWASTSRIAHNTTGLALQQGIAHRGCGVELVANTTNGAFTDATCADTAPASTTPTTPATPAAPVTTKPAQTTYCIVPSLRGRTLADAKSALAAAHCRVGRIQRTTAKAKLRNKVVKQKVQPGVIARQGTRIALVLGRR